MVRVGINLKLLLKFRKGVIMKEPEFPREFLKHCPKVKDAKNFLPDEPEEVLQMYAECAFHRAGCGMECENCKLFMTRPYLQHELDSKFLPLIEDYYRKTDEYEKYLEEDRKNLQDCGSGI
jgi:hypothetical protein